MENRSSAQNDALALGIIVKTLCSKRKTFLKVWVVTFALSCLWIFPQPRYYKAEVMLAPEMGGDNMGSLGALASSFGVNLGGESSDAIYPELYPDLMSSTDFAVSLFSIPVKTIDGEVETDLYTYLTKHQKTAFYKLPTIWIKRKIKELLPSKKAGVTNETEVNPFFLTERQLEVADRLRESVVSCSVDKLTNVFSIRIVAQDPLVAATLADSVRVRLQTFITAYRTNKARIDMEHYLQLQEQTKAEYEQAVITYSSYVDKHRNVTSKVAEEEVTKLSRDVELKYNAFSAVTLQVQATEAKLQEKTPAFTILQNAYVPQKPAGPKRMMFVAFMLVLSTVITTGYLFKNHLTKRLTR